MNFPMAAQRVVVNHKSVPYGTKTMMQPPSPTLMEPPATRREARRHSRRETILDVAGESFLENGYAGTTMNAIAARLGGSKGTLWSYFPSKDVLFAAVLDRATEAFRGQTMVILNPDHAPEVALRRFCRGFLERLTMPQSIALHRLVLGEVQRFPEVGRIFHERAPAVIRELLTKYLTGAMDKGRLRQHTPAVAAEQLIGLCLSGCHQRLMLGLIDRATPALLNADTDHAMETFMRAHGVDR